jgi:tricorn protease
MRKTLAFTFCLLVVAASAAVAGTPARFMQYPDIHGDTIVFSYEGDLWSVSARGGEATRLTTYPGNEFAAKVSPDGKTIAFTGSYDGTPSVYVMPIGGGPPQRLTYTGTNVQPVAWTPDGTHVIVRSGHENTFRPIVKLYAVDLKASPLERLPMDRGILCSFNADGTKAVYNRRGNEEYYWKRYKGGQYTDIWLCDFKANTYQPLTDYVGKNAYPMWIGKEMYFVSDRGPKGIANLFTYDFATKKVEQVTTFDDLDVQQPSSDGLTIVFMRGGKLTVLDVATRAVREVRVEVASDRWQLAQRTINPTEYIQSMSISNDGKTAAFEARGDIFLVPADDALPTRNLTDTPGIRERMPRISPDGKKVAYFSDRTGEYQLYVQDVAGDKPAEALTTRLDRIVYHLEWSPDGSKILFGNKDFALFYIDVASKRLVKFATSNQLKNDEFYWEVSDYSWSPDGKWIVYSFVEFNRNNRIYLYNLEQNKTYLVTDGFYDSMNPSFDANGDLLFFLSYRNFDSRLDIFEDDHVVPDPVQVMAVQLKAGQKPPFEKGPKEERGEGKDEKKAESFRIDLDGIAGRIFKVPVKPGNYFYLKAGKGAVTWASSDTFTDDEIEQVFTPSGRDIWTLHVYDVSAQKETTVEGTIADWRLSPNREQMITRKGNAYFVSGVAKVQTTRSLGDKLDLERMVCRVVPREEWLQIFNDSWRWYRDFFYDPAMHGRDWKKIGDTYRAFVPELSSRADLNWLLSQMVGELCVSHTYIGGGDMGPQKAPEAVTTTGLFGADLAADPSTFYRFARIYGPTDYDRELKAPLVRPDLDVKEGDYLLAIDGHEVRVPDNPYWYLQVVKGQKIRLTVSSKPEAAGARTYEVEPVRSEYSLRYNRWLADNIEKVLKATNNEVGYMHITAMGGDNVAQFDKFWRAFRYKKGLIIDVRGNGGGWTEYFLIDKLERPMVGYNVLANMVPFRYPGSTSTAHLVAITNEYNGSDGEAFLEHFKAGKLGIIIGVPSWGGLVGIVNTQRTVDNGRVEQSNNAFWGREGKWWVENHGVDPDIVVDNDPASASAGKDVQLEKAIEVVLQQIKEKPFTFPPRPPYPVK